MISDQHYFCNPFLSWSFNDAKRNDLKTPGWCGRSTMKPDSWTLERYNDFLKAELKKLVSPKEVKLEDPI